MGGVPAATAVWRGLLFGLFSFLAFFTVLAATLVPFGSALSFVLAVASAMGVQATTLMLVRSSAVR